MRAVSACLILAAAAAPVFAADVTFEGDVAPIFNNRCAGCHSTAAHMGGLILEDYTGAMKGGSHGAVIVAGKSTESRMVLMITGQVKPAMPMDGTKLAESDIAKIKAWIDAGAPAPAAGVSAAPKPAAKLPHIDPLIPAKPQIYDLAWSPDGKLIALAGFRSVRLVDAESKQQIAELSGEADAVRAVAFSRDGKLLAAAGGLPARSGEVKIWDVASRKLVSTIHGHADCIFAVAFTPDGKSVATSSYDKLIKLWDVADGKEVRTFKDHIDAIYALAFTPDGKRLVSGAADRTVKVWDVATGERLYTLSEPQDGINTVAIDPTGHYVAAGGLDKSIRIWSLGEKSGTLENSLIAHEDAILRLAWSPDGKMLASSSADRTVKIFTVPDLNEVQSFPQTDWVYGLGYSPDGHRIAVGQFDGKWDEVLPPGLHRAAR